MYFNIIRKINLLLFYKNFLIKIIKNFKINNIIKIQREYSLIFAKIKFYIVKVQE